MFNGIDHIVVAVADLDRAIAAWSSAGFVVVRGGRHNIGTQNALIAFADGAYVELIAFLNPIPDHPWFKALGHGGGFVDFCAKTDDLDNDVAALRSAGAQIGDPTAMTRDRPDGYRLSWVLAMPLPPLNGQLPFLIRDETARDERVPRERSHRAGASGLRRVTLAVEDPQALGEIYHSVINSDPVPRNRSDLDASGVELKIGPHEIHLMKPNRTSSPLSRWITERGPSPFRATLRGEKFR